MFVGGMGGTKWEQSKLAQEFQPPEKDKFRDMKVIGPFLALLGFVLICYYGTLWSGAVSDFTASVLKTIAGFLILGGAFWFMSDNKHYKQERERHEAAKRQDALMENVYYRLRYIYAEHIIFDPVSGMEAPATRENMMTMLTHLARA